MEREKGRRNKFVVNIFKINELMKYLIFNELLKLNNVKLIFFVEYYVER